MSNRFIEIDRSQPITLPGNLEGWLEGNDLAHFIVEVVEALDTRAIEAAYQGGGSAPYPLKMLWALRFYCYAKGIFSSRKIERATYELIPVCTSPGEPIRTMTVSTPSANGFCGSWSPSLCSSYGSPMAWGF